MNRLGKRELGSPLLFALAALLAVPGALVAENMHGAPLDLRIKEAPQRELSSLHMRTAAADDVAVKKKSKPKATARKSKLDYRPIPTEVRDIRERILFKTNVGYGLDVSRLSGNAAKTGFAPADVTDRDGNEFADTRQYLLGDAIVGTRGVLMPTLNSYFLSRFSFDNGGGAFTALNNVYDSDESQQLLIRAGYAELDGLGGEKGGVLDSIYFRAGRQFRYGSNRFVANFDGVTAAYDHPMLEVSGFFGQRVSNFYNNDEGLFNGDNRTFGGVVAGVGLKLRGEEIVSYPADVNIDYLRFNSGEGDPNRQVVEANSRVRVSDATRVYLRGRFLDDGLDADDSTGVGRVGGQVRQSFGDNLLVILDAEKNFAREVAFDYIGASPLDVVNVGQEIGLAIGTPQNSTLVGLRANYQLNPTLEGYAFYRNRIVKNAEDADAFSRPFQEVGLASSSLIGKRLSASAQYKYRIHSLESGANEAGSDFDDTAGSGVKKMHEVSGEARYNFGKKKADAAFGVYARIYDVETPYAFLDNDGRGGGRFDVGYWATSFVRLRATGEVAQPSQSLAEDIDTLVSMRLLMEASF
jgi:hypothetical protein